MLSLIGELLSRLHIPSVGLGGWGRIEGLYSQADAPAVSRRSSDSVIVLKVLIIRSTPMKAATVCTALSGISVAPKTQMLAERVIEPVKALVTRIEVHLLIEEIQGQFCVAGVVIIWILVLPRGLILPLSHCPRMSLPILQDCVGPRRAPCVGSLKRAILTRKWCSTPGLKNGLDTVHCDTQCDR